MRRLLCLILVFCSLFSLTACHGNLVEKGQPTAIPITSYDVPDTFDTSRQFEISFWAKNDNNAVQRAIYEKAVADFHAIYPNITVKLKPYNDYGDIYKDVITNIPTDTTPNVCITYPDHIATYLTGGDTVVPLDDFFSHPAYGLGGSEVKFDSPKAEEIIPQFLNECSFDGYHYAIPYMRSTEACYVNKTYVEKLGYTLPEVLTWDFVWEVCQAAMAKNADGTFAVNGQKKMEPFIYKSTDNMMIQMLKQLDAGYSTDAGEVLIFNDTTQEVLETIAEHAKNKEFSTFKIVTYPANFLNKGQCIFAVDSTAGATWVGCNSPLNDVPEETVQFETVVMPIPQYDTKNPKMISQGPSMCVFNKEDPQEVLASWLFAQYMLTNAVQIAYAQTEGYAPVTSKAQQSPEYLNYLSRRGEDNDLYYDVKIDATKLLMDNTANTFVTPVFNGSISLRNAAGELIETVTKTARRGKTLDYSNLFKEVTSLYHLDEIVPKKIDVSIPEDTDANNSEETQATILKEKEPLPKDAVYLFWGLGICWFGIILAVLLDAIKKNAKKKRENY